MDRASGDRHARVDGGRWPCLVGLARVGIVERVRCQSSKLRDKIAGGATAARDTEPARLGGGSTVSGAPSAERRKSRFRQPGSRYDRNIVWQKSIPAVPDYIDANSVRRLGEVADRVGLVEHAILAGRPGRSAWDGRPLLPANHPREGRHCWHSSGTTRRLRRESIVRHPNRAICLY